jgi:formate hydrogenlyase subunit 3/multisubunit Na+/H+ antiporter MnhD subunit
MLNFDNTTPPNHLANRFPRAFGMLLFIVSLGLGKWQIYNPLHAAEDQRSEVWFSGKLIGLTIILGLYSILFIVFGNRPNQWFKADPGNVEWKNVVLIVIMVIIGLGVYLYVERQLAAQGYHR